MMHIKLFNPWNEIKQRINDLTRKVLFREGKIWWIRMGVNVGIEQDGKSAEFTRPVLILKKYNNCHFLALPLTTKQMNEKFSFHLPVDIEFLKKESWVVFSQIRAMDSKRLSRRMGKLSDNILNDIQKKFLKHFSLKTCNK